MKNKRYLCVIVGLVAYLAVGISTQAEAAKCCYCNKWGENGCNGMATYESLTNNCGRKGWLCN